MKKFIHNLFFLLSFLGPAYCFASDDSILETVEPGSVAADDVFQFLENRELQILGKVSSLFQTLPSPLVPNEEAYLVKDKYGNRSFVSLAPSGSVLNSIALHQLFTCLGLDAMPARPILVKRGKNNLPTLEDASALGGPIATEVKNDEWSPALIVPVLKEDRWPTEAEFTTEMLAESAKHLVTAYILGMNSATYAYKSGKLIFLYAEQLLRTLFSQDTPQKRLRHYFSTFFYGRLQKFTTEEAEAFAKELSRYFDRLELIEKDHFETVFGPLIDGTIHLTEGQLNTISATTRQSRLRTVIKSARAEVEKYFHDRIGYNFRSVPFNYRNGNAVENFIVSPVKYNFRFSSATTLSIVDPEFRKANAKHLLFAYYSSGKWMKKILFEKWSQELNGTDPVEVLLEDATRWDTTVRMVSSESLGSMARFSLKGPTQFYLDSDAPRTLVVYSNNDQEGRLINEIVKGLSKEVGLVPLRLTLGRTQLLNSSDVSPLIRTAIARKCSRVVVCELGGIPAVDKVRFEEAGLQLIELDHHNKFPDDWQKLSTAEQLMRVYNYQPNMRQMITAINDRSSIFGFQDLGFTTYDQLERFLTAEGIFDFFSDAANKVGYFHNKLEVEPIIVIRNTYSNFPAVVASIGVQTFPIVPTVLGPNGRYLRISARPDLIWKIIHEFKDRDLVWGGDGSRAMYLTIRAAPRLSVETLQQRVIRLIHPTDSVEDNNCVHEFTYRG